MNNDQMMHVIYYLALILLLLPVVLPVARSRSRWLRHAAIWLLAGGLLVALYQLGVWLIA